MSVSINEPKEVWVSTSSLTVGESGAFLKSSMLGLSVLTFFFLSALSLSLHLSLSLSAPSLFLHLSLSLSLLLHSFSIFPSLSLLFLSPSLLPLFSSLLSFPLFSFPPLPTFRLLSSPCPTLGCAQHPDLQLDI